MPFITDEPAPRQHFVNYYGYNPKRKTHQICALTACGKPSVHQAQKGGIASSKLLVDCPACKRALKRG